MLWPGSIVADKGEIVTEGLDASTVTLSVAVALSAGVAGTVVPVSVTLTQYVTVPADPSAEYVALVAPPIGAVHPTFEYHW